MVPAASVVSGVAAVLLWSTSTVKRVASVGVTWNEYWAAEPDGLRATEPTWLGGLVKGNCCAYSSATSPLVTLVTWPLIVALASVPSRYFTKTSPFCGANAEERLAWTLGVGTPGVLGDVVGDADGVGWRETGCTATGGGVPVPFWVPWFFETGAARAVPAATTAIPAAIAMAAGIGRRCRSRRGCSRGRGRGCWSSCTRSTPVPCCAAGAPIGHSAASSSAASPRCERPRRSQSWPYARDAMVLSSVTRLAASAGRDSGSLAIPVATSGRSGSGSGSSGTGWVLCCRSRSSGSPLNGGWPVRHS